MNLRPIQTGEKKKKLPFESLDKMKLPWYFETWFEKLIVVLGTFSLIYSVLRIIFQGFW